MSDRWKANVEIHDNARYPYTLQRLAEGTFRLRAEVVLAPLQRRGTHHRWVLHLFLQEPGTEGWSAITPGGPWNTDYWTLCWHETRRYWFLAPATSNTAARPDERWSERLWRRLATHLADSLDLDPDHPTLEPAWRRKRADDDGDAPDLAVTGAWQELEPRPQNPDDIEEEPERSIPGRDDDEEIPF